MKNRNIAILLVLFATQLLSGCESIGFYGQAIRGQLHIVIKQRPIDDIIQNPETQAGLREQLRLVMALRVFAQNALALDVGDSYAEYADLGRPYVVWNVTAAPALSLDPLKWCFPIAGCVSYRGYFSEQAAKEKAADLRERGNDVYVGGVGAYSTLGWFDDPVLNSFLRRSEEGLAGLLFHELSHRQLYVKGDTAFNESFATAVQLEGLRRWYEAAGESAKFSDYVIAQERRARIIEMITLHRHRLSKLYSEMQQEPEALAKKRLIIADIKADYARLKREWPGYKAFDGWMAGPINNAKLSTISNYNGWVPSFRQLLKENNGDIRQFYHHCAELAHLEKSERDQRLSALAQRTH